MINPTIFVLLLLFLGSCQTEQVQTVQVVKFETLQNLMSRGSGKIEVINFWATWCKPCIKELPYFQSLHHERADDVKVTLISLDFADELDSKVIPFVAKHQLTTDVLLLDEIDYNSWIDKVDTSWSGAIPATLAINHSTGQRIFVEKELSKEELFQIINTLLN